MSHTSTQCLLLCVVSDMSSFLVTSTHLTEGLITVLQTPTRSDAYLLVMSSMLCSGIQTVKPVPGLSVDNMANLCEVGDC